jgi:hypothetical protein
MSPHLTVLSSLTTVGLLALPAGPAGARMSPAGNPPTIDNGNAEQVGAGTLPIPGGGSTAASSNISPAGAWRASGLPWGAPAGGTGTTAAGTNTPSVPGFVPLSPGEVAGAGALGLLVRVGPGDAVQTVSRVMADRHLAQVLVQDDAGRIYGVLNQFDIVRAVADQGQAALSMTAAQLLVTPTPHAAAH